MALDVLFDPTVPGRKAVIAVANASGIAIFGASRRLVDVVFAPPAHAQWCLVAEALNKASDAGARGVCEVFQQSAVTLLDESRTEDGGGSDGNGIIRQDTANQNERGAA